VVTSLALARSEPARANAQTICLQLLKIGAVVTVSVRRLRFTLSETAPRQAELIAAFRALGVAAQVDQIE
jgi:cation diffusion facilitator CzcD-associated flavoprotein CzcO